MLVSVVSRASTRTLSAEPTVPLGVVPAAAAAALSKSGVPSATGLALPGTTIEAGSPDVEAYEAPVTSTVLSDIFPVIER